jgi:hypothetical protein
MLRFHSSPLAHRPSQACTERGQNLVRSPRAALPLLALLLAAAATQDLRGQGADLGEGHAEVNGRTVFANWNFQAGSQIPDDFSTYPEFLPFLGGWDFRINLPFVRYKLAASGLGSAAPMVGVVEGPANTIARYRHRNNSIWLFQVNAGGDLFYKLLPSSRSLTGPSPSPTRNVRSLTADWRLVGDTGPHRRPPPFLREPVAAAVVGEGLGIATVYVVARSAEGGLFINQILVDREDPTWTSSWAALPGASSTRASLTPAFDGKLALAWVSSTSGRVNVAVFTPSTQTWSSPVEVAPGGSPPQLLWDGTALHLLFVGSPSPRLRHTSATAPSLVFQSLTSVSPFLAVQQSQFHAMVFNERIHVAVRQDDGSVGPTRVFYSKTTTQPGEPSSWSAPSETGLTTFTNPRIASVQNLIFVIATDPAGRILYSTKDMLSRGNDLTGGVSSDRWISPGTELASGGGEGYRQLEVLAFNDDVYLTAYAVSSDDVVPNSLWIVNMSRAAMKNLFTDKLGMRLLWGEPGGGSRKMGAGEFAKFNVNTLYNTYWPLEGDIPLIGDFNDDGSDDIVRFTQKAESGVGPAPAYVSLFDSGFKAPTVWHPFFSLDGEIPGVGDFNGDGKDDIITFTQSRQLDAAGNLIGQAPVWVSLSNGTRFQTSRVWHPFFSLRGEIPLVGDFNGDQMDDIITFTQSRQLDQAGNVLGDATVWVSISEGNRFRTSSVWHPYFSLPGEIPLVGDFNGDMKDDIITFTQTTQVDFDGHLIGTAPVYVALSEGDHFGPSQLWHTFFSLRGEIPRVADFNLDGKDDIITFLHDQGSPGFERVSFVAFSTGSSFSRSSTWVSDFASRDTIPFIGNFSRQTLGTITGRPEDSERRFPDLMAFRSDGSVDVSFALFNYPLPSGAPWERYKWFTQKGVGASMFPEWIWEASRPCLAEDHRLALLGQAGTGGEDLTNLSVRMGSRMGHVLEEVGHSVFANCVRSSSDPFGIFADIFSKHWRDGGFGGSVIADICAQDDGRDYYDCRSSDSRFGRSEHIFLHLMIQYLVDPEVFRARTINEPNQLYREHLAFAYGWLKTNWFDGLEFHTLPPAGAEMKQEGLQCGPPAQCLGTIFRRQSFHRGDANGSGTADLSDAVFVLSYLFNGGPAPSCLEAANVNNDTQLDISDGIALLGYLFLGAPAPPAPGPPPRSCGTDPDAEGSARDLGCEAYDACGG